MKDEVIVPVTLDHEELLPSYSTVDSAGADVRAHIEKDLVIPQGGSALIPTGIRSEIPSGYEIQIRPRSGLALKHQVTVLNTPGTIDADYRGEIGVILINHSNKPFIVTKNMRIAQLVLAKYERAKFVTTKKLALSARGEGGFGHSGTH
ncbi:dUTP diphosphatase [Candidatus Aerophobetes bacterium]|uniref:Deoxyuridine 5'-triphosphate nucleotidohydrolase n=1 Tax=Aerophobetes bacterium TaxID=2030807 RepID=A0A2A4YLC2_UNCAE|nr:MAG: dUTP diphosphatase [Candidatus Aerophobetes bacterium]